MNKIKSLSKKVSHYLLVCFFYVSYVGYANASFSIGSGSGIFSKITTFFQAIVDFLGGPATLFVIFMCFASAIILWIMMPKNAAGAVGWLFRVCLGAIALFSIGTIVTYIKTF